MTLETVFSPCRQYRYTLWRQWWQSELFLDKFRTPRFVQFIGLNPSTADETENDATITRCINFAQRWGYHAMYMTNLFAFRSTDSAVMRKAADPVGKDNNHWLYHVAANAHIVIPAWGNGGAFKGRAEVVLKHLMQTYAIGKLHHLGHTNLGQPRHPLYLRKNLNPIPYK